LHKFLDCAEHQYINISIYCNTDGHNMISIHPTTVLISQNIMIYINISLFLKGINVKAYPINHHLFIYNM